MKLKLVTPEKILFEEEVLSVSLPTTEGEITILPNHAPLVMMLKSGVATVTKTDKTIDDLAISGGFIQVGSNEVTILADMAERGEHLTIDAIKEAKERAKRAMEETRDVDDVAFAHAAAALERELARERAALRRMSRHGA
ncbi:MAG: synthase epsilon chain [Candidatus Parcubacteria bacterium]|jgi:F-type H+-transporting ATPase subunit epsilon